MAESSSSSSGWEFIGNDGKRVECSDDNQSETSDSSIEVVSMDTSDLHSLESIQLPQIPSASSGPFLVLRLRSKEKDSLTESDESDDHKIEKNEGTLKRRKKSKSRQPKSSEPEMSTPSEEERDFVTIPDPEKENAECVDNAQAEIVKENVNRESQNEVDDGPMQGFQVVEASQVEHQEPVIPPPFEGSGEVDQRNGEEEEDFMFLGVPQDDPDTESSPEIEDEQDDRMESDRSGDPFSDDYSTLSNVDISDLMAENNLIRQYVFRPNPSVNVTLNMVMVVVISVAVGLGIGHAIGSAKERFVNSNIQEMSVNMDLDWDCPFEEDVEKLTLENRGLKEEANKAQNEVVDLRSEVRKLRYSPIVSTAEEKKRQADQKNMALKSEMNMLQHENEDLKKLVGSLKYGSHPGNADGGCQQNLSDKLNEVEEPRNSEPLVKKTDREIKNELVVEEDNNDLKDAMRKPMSIVNIVHSGGNQKPQLHESNSENSDKHLSDFSTLHSDVENEEAVEYHHDEEKYEDVVQMDGKRALEEKLPDQGVLLYDEEVKAIEDEEVTNTSTENVKPPKTEHEDMIDDDDGVEVLDEDYGDDVDDDEEMTNTSTENVQNLDDQPNTGSNGSEKEGENREDGAGKKVDWRETMQKILNKTKASVSDVSQQIQDTWKQVKNMSGDLWKKNEPVLTKLKTNLVSKVEEAAQKITSKLEEKTKHWFNKRRKQKENDPKHMKHDPKKEHRHRNNHWKNQDKEEKYPKHRQNDDMYREKREKHEKRKTSKYYKAKTGRRSYEEEEDHKPWNRQQRRAEKLEKRRSNKFNKMKGRFQQMHEYRFCQMNMKKRHKFFNILDDFDERFNADRLLDPDHKWYSCQWDWWWNAISFHLNTFMLMDPSCQGTLLPWQEGILESGRWECPGFPQNLKRQSNDEDYDEDDEKDHDKMEKVYRKHFKNMPYFGDSEPLPNSNYTEEFKGCDPTKGICDFNKNDSWYLMKMKFRQYQRFMDAKEKGKTEWMFSRASHRRDEREKTDCNRGVHGAHVCG